MFFSLKLLSANKYALQSRTDDDASSVAATVGRHTKTKEAWLAEVARQERAVGLSTVLEKHDQSEGVKHALLTERERSAYRASQEPVGSQPQYVPPKPRPKPRSVVRAKSRRSTDGLVITQGVTRAQLYRRKLEQKAAASHDDDVSSLEDWTLPESLLDVGSEDTYSSAPKHSEFKQQLLTITPLMQHDLTHAACQTRVMGVSHDNVGGSEYERSDVYKRRTRLASAMGFVGDEVNRICELPASGSDSLSARTVLLKQHQRLFPVIEMLMQHNAYHQLPVAAGGAADPSRWLQAGQLDAEFELRYVPKAYTKHYKTTEDRVTHTIHVTPPFRREHREDVEVQRRVEIQAGLMLVKKGRDGEAGQLLCFKMNEHVRADLFQGVNIAENFGRLAEVEEASAKLLKPDETKHETVEYARAKALFNFGVNFEREGKDVPYFVETSTRGAVKNCQPFIEGMKPLAADDWGMGRRSDDFRGVLSARNMDKDWVAVDAGLADMPDPRTHLDESRLSDSARLDLDARRSKQFQIITALHTEMYHSLVRANKAMELLDELTVAIADAKITMARCSSLAQVDVKRVDWQGVKKVWRKMQEAHLVPGGRDVLGDFANLNISLYLDNISAEIAQANALRLQLYGSDVRSHTGVLERWGMRETAAGEVKQACELALDAHKQLRKRVKEDMIDSVAETGVPSRPITLHHLVTRKYTGLRAALRVKVDELRKHGEVVGRSEPQRRPVDVTWSDRNSNEFTPMIKDWGRYYKNDDQQLFDLKEALFNSNVFSGFQKRIEHLVEKFESMEKRFAAKPLSALSASEKRRYRFHMMGRAKAQGMQLYCEVIAKATSVDDLRTALAGLHHKLPNLHYSLRLFDDEGNYEAGPRHFHMDQHRHDSFKRSRKDRHPLESSNGLFGGMGARKTTERMRKVLDKLDSLLQSHVPQPVQPM
ncbi:MAG: hypothetical protein P1U40_07350 [Coxiellaceae bacterium]|nr:hypothetical protein [Coxiellaceae bacterium]